MCLFSCQITNNIQHVVLWQTQKSDRKHLKHVKGINSPSYHVDYHVTCQRSSSCYSFPTSDTEAPGPGWLSCHLIEVLVCVLPQCSMLDSTTRGPCADLDFKKHQHSSSILITVTRSSRRNVVPVTTQKKVKQAAQIERLSSELHVDMSLIFVCMLFLIIKHIL